MNAVLTVPDCGATVSEAAAAKTGRVGTSATAPRRRQPRGSGLESFRFLESRCHVRSPSWCRPDLGADPTRRPFKTTPKEFDYPLGPVPTVCLAGDGAITPTASASLPRWQSAPAAAPAFGVYCRPWG
jgi:hypothetical protein